MAKSDDKKLPIDEVPSRLEAALEIPREGILRELRDFRQSGWNMSGDLTRGFDITIPGQSSPVLSERIFERPQDDYTIDLEELYKSLIYDAMYFGGECRQAVFGQ